MDPRNWCDHEEPRHEAPRSGPRCASRCQDGKCQPQSRLSCLDSRHVYATSVSRWKCSMQITLPRRRSKPNSDGEESRALAIMKSRATKHLIAEYGVKTANTNRQSGCHVWIQDRYARQVCQILATPFFHLLFQILCSKLQSMWALKNLLLFTSLIFSWRGASSLRSSSPFISCLHTSVAF